tara:strand:- start:7905 stop:8573 length:669 start_codon:yes stop_codon:yes gene_type:complete
MANVPTQEEIDDKIKYTVMSADNIFGGDIANASSYSDIKAMIKHHEGYNYTVSLDDDGYYKAGHGTKLQPTVYSDMDKDERTGLGWQLGDSISPEIGETWFNRHFNESTVLDAKKVFPNFDSFNENQKGALLDIMTVSGLTKFTSKSKGFPKLIQEANKPNPNWQKVADQYKYAYPEVNKSDSTYSDWYIKAGYGNVDSRGDHIFELLQGTKTIQDILNIYK